MIKIENLFKSFKDFTAVNDISFHINAGDILGMLGPNGAGKSTTINMISGVINKDSGTIQIMGKDIDKNSSEIKKNMGVVPQDIAIFYDLTAKENLNYFGSLYGLKGELLKKRVDETLEFIGLSNVANKLPKKFSGGMKRRLNIGCAIVHQPKIIILDEPTVGIDAQSRNHIMETIKELNKRGSTIIYTSHYMEEIETLCNKIVIIDQGTVIEQGTKNELLEKYNKVEQFQFRLNKSMDKDFINAISNIPGVIECKNDKDELDISAELNSKVFEHIIQEISNREVGFSSINMKKKNLEDIFLLLTGKKLRD